MFIRPPEWDADNAPSEPARRSGRLALSALGAVVGTFVVGFPSASS